MKKRAHFDHCSGVCFMHELLQWCVSSYARRRAYYAERLRAYDATVSKICTKQSWLIMGGFISRQSLQMLLKQLNKNLKINI